MLSPQLNTIMRFSEFKQPALHPYRIVVVLSDNSSAETLIYSDTPENAWLIASKQYGNGNIVSVNGLDRPTVEKNDGKQSAIQFWTDRFRKYARLAKPEPKPVEFADQVDDYLERQDARSLARVKAEKAKRNMKKISNH